MLLALLVMVLVQGNKLPRSLVNKTTQQLKELVVHGLLVPGPEALQLDIMVCARTHARTHVRTHASVAILSAHRGGTHCRIH